MEYEIIFFIFCMWQVDVGICKLKRLRAFNLTPSIKSGTPRLERNDLDTLIKISENFEISSFVSKILSGYQIFCEFTCFTAVVRQEPEILNFWKACTGNFKISRKVILEIMTFA